MLSIIINTCRLMMLLGNQSMFLASPTDRILILTLACSCRAYLGERLLTLSPREPAAKLKSTFFFFLKKELPFTFTTIDLRPILLADRPMCSPVASPAYRARRDRLFRSSKQPAEAPAFLFSLTSITVTKVFFSFGVMCRTSIFTRGAAVHLISMFNRPDLLPPPVKSFSAKRR